MNRYLFHRDLESDASPGLLCFIGVILSLCSLSIGTVVGYEFRDWQQRVHEANKPLPVRKAAQNPPPSLIRCEDPIRSREEVSRICRHRKAAI